MGKFIDLTGKVFFRFTVLERGENSNSGHPRWICRCSCGTIKLVRGCHLVNKKGTHKSCGCLHKEVLKSRTGSNHPSYIDGLSRFKKYKHNTANYRANKLKRTPSWSDLDIIKDIYDNCPIGHEVDHIYPLNGRTISGLHVPDNLQYLERQLHRSKKKIFIPEIISKTGVVTLYQP